MDANLRVGIVGVGNCASSFVQGLTYYPRGGIERADPRDHARRDRRLPYRRRSRSPSAFDVNATKVGRDVAEAIFAPPNNTIRFAEVAPTGVVVARGPTLDGIGRYLADEIEESDAPRRQRRRGARPNRHRGAGLLPAGRLASARPRSTPSRRSRPAAPSSTASRRSSPRDPEWRAALRRARPADHRRRHQEPGRRHHRPPGAHQPLPRARRAAGPHLPAQLRRQHRLPQHARARAAGLEEDLQDAGGDQPARRAARPPATSTSARATTCPGSPTASWRYIRMEGTTFGGVPLNLELKLEVWDSPNSAGVVIDAVRCAKLALDRGLGGRAGRPVELLHEVAAGAVHRRRGARAHPRLHLRRGPPAGAPPVTPVRAARRGGRGMKLVIFGLTISSSWGNGHATLWRGLVRALARRGGRVVFFERDAPSTPAHRDLGRSAAASSSSTPTGPTPCPHARRHLADADAAIVTSYCPDGGRRDRAGARGARGPRGLLRSRHARSPSTGSRRGEATGYIGPDGLAGFDLVLSFTGGARSTRSPTASAPAGCARSTAASTPSVHRPAAPRPEYRGGALLPRHLRRRPPGGARGAVRSRRRGGRPTSAS